MKCLNFSSVSNKYGIGFWKPAGIIHQVVLENWFPVNDDRYRLLL
jgi:aconitase A